jgi:bifunctional non-homologous end joining protein LigD
MARRTASTGSLETYRAKRDFARTPEPPPRKKPTGRKLSYCIQKHAASRLHYDFRLELDGVLKSWAVPKGPSFDPTEKRLAVHVEDHPIEYGSFEGVIPEGEYGGGTVLLWDRGTWEPHGDPREAYRKGKLSFEVHGEKLHGGWALVRMHGERSEGGKNWLLIKEKDAAADSRDVVAERPESVKGGRTLDEIAAAEGASKRQLRRALQIEGRSEVPAPEPATRRAAAAARSTRGARGPKAGGARKASTAHKGVKAVKRSVTRKAGKAGATRARARARR